MLRSMAPLLLLPFVINASVLYSQDFEGSSDHPLITRYPGSVIAWYDVQAYQEYEIATGPVTGYRHIDEWLPVSGKLTRIYYVLKGAHTISEVYANYLQALKSNDFEMLANGLHPGRNVAKQVGGRTWLGVYYTKNVLPTNGIINLLAGSATTGGSGFVAGKLERADGDVYVCAGLAQYRQDEVVAMVDIIEAEEVQADLIQIDAEAMSRDIERYGKVALYGIFFDHDQSTIKPESKSALDEIAALLRNRPQLALYVVGHTDLRGSLDYNLNLSRQRAEAVVKALIGEYGIAASRLTAKGVGPLVPVFTNQSEQGRAKNRRVELVEK